MTNFTRYLVLGCICFFHTTLSFSQNPFFSILHQGDDSDSSYYDIAKVGESDLWAIGEYGVITEISGAGELQSISYPNQGVDLYKLDKFDDQHFIIAGDEGYVYLYDADCNEWSHQQIEGYEKSSFYNLCVIDDQTAFLCGGKSKIIQEKRVIPFGFILKTEDGGHTWQKVYVNLLNMVWSVRYDKESAEVLALLYAPIKSKILRSPDIGINWEVDKKIRGLFHEFNLIDEEIVLSGGNSARTMNSKSGMVAVNDEIYSDDQTGMFWDIENKGDLTMASGTKGNLLFKAPLGGWKLVSTPVNISLYEIVFIDDHSAYVVGSRQTIMKVRFE